MAKHTTRARRGRLLRIGTALGLLLSVAVVWQSSRSAFTDTTTNPNNQFTSASVTVTDDKNGTALFNLSGLKPGDSGDNCILVTYSGTYTNSTVNFYVDNFTDNSTGGAWANGIQLTVTTGGGSCPLGSITGATTPVNAQTLKSLNTNNDFPAGASMYGWSTPATGAARPYNLHYQVLNALSDDGTQGIQGKTVSLDLVWQAATN